MPALISLTQYKAFDGRMFSDRDDARKYEVRICIQRAIEDGLASGRIEMTSSGIAEFLSSNFMLCVVSADNEHVT